MSRQLFEDVVEPTIRLGTRQWYSVPLSIISHVAVLGVLVAAPIVATRALPAPDSLVVFVTAPPLPEPPTPMTPDPAPHVTEPETAVLETAAPIAPGPEVEVDPSQTPSPIGWSARPDATGLAVGVGRLVPLTPAPPRSATPAQGPVLAVGGDVRAPVKLHDVLPVYPPIARSARAQGVVLLEAIIGKDGLVRNVRVLRSVPLLDQAAIDAVRQWRYSTPTLNGVPVDVSMTVSVSFQLR
jgi:protein TonB